MAVNVLTGTDSGVEELKQQCRVADIGTSGVLLKMEVGIRKGAWQRAWRYPAYLWSLRWVYAVKKNPEVGIRRIPAYTPNTPLFSAALFSYWQDLHVVLV